MVIFTISLFDKKSFSRLCKEKKNIQKKQKNVGRRSFQTSAFILFFTVTIVFEECACVEKTPQFFIFYSVFSTRPSQKKYLSFDNMRNKNNAFLSVLIFFTHTTIFPFLKFF